MNEKPQVSYEVISFRLFSEIVKMSDWFYFGTRQAVRTFYGLAKHLSRNKLEVIVQGSLPDEPTLLTVNHCYKARFWFFGWHEKWADHWLLLFIKTKRKIHFVVQDKQYMKPITRFILERLETFSAKEIRKGIRYARNGEIVAIFPQGEAHRMYENKYYEGTAFIAEKGFVDITPIKIENYNDKAVYLKFLPQIKTKGKTREQITQEIEKIYK